MADNEEADEATVTEQETPPRGVERAGGRLPVICHEYLRRCMTTLKNRLWGENLEKVIVAKNVLKVLV